MKPELTNNGLQPPEGKTKYQIEREEFEEKALNWVKYCFRDDPYEIFDLYEHDREVAKSFHNWIEASEWMDATIINDGLKIGEYYINTKSYTQDKITFDQLWEIYCSKPENK